MQKRLTRIQINTFWLCVGTGLLIGIPRKNEYVIQAKHFETGTTDDVLCWYITLQEILEKKPCEDAEAKFGMVELLLGGQGKKDFMCHTVYYEQRTDVLGKPN